ncbi:energy transducer TonB [Lysobacter sp. GX 14042]|uniref:energy transducer TonB n=1 Tax=Lysobacter sp. GX 14042 TaxID=2907155 RepID=UPI001F3E9092|nr:energy transducer TonB [Lysobacter sp. GX 14042]MCE7033327.1 energy transducer TonB [Lysobacter sp. GX 14042]
MSRVLVPALLALAMAFPAHASLTPTKRVEPQYPADAARAGTEGFVEVEFSVSADGKVESVSVVNAKPSRVFESAAVRAVKQWEFAPGGGRGKVRLDFTL